MSKSREVLARLLEIVSYETDVSSLKILSKCSEMEVVDARWICVKLLRIYGFHPSQIAVLLRITPRYAQLIISDFEDRLAVSNMMRINYEHCLVKFGNQNELND